MIVSELNEDQRRALASLFVSAGWALLKQEFEVRKKNLIQDLVYGADRNRDGDRRAGVVAIEMLLGIEKEIFMPSSPPPEQGVAFQIPNSVNRY